MARRVPGPRQPLLRCRACRRPARRRLRRRRDRPGAAPVSGCGTSKRRRSSGSRHRRRQADAGEVGREREQPREAERQQIAALRGDQRMQFVEHDAPERAEQVRRVGRGEQQRQLLGRGQQDVAADRAAGAGASRPACRRCGSRSGSAAPSRRPAARDCARCRRRAPSAARCRACAARPRGGASAGGHERARLARRACALSSTRLGKNPASVLPAPVGAISSTERPARAFASSSS